MSATPASDALADEMATDHPAADHEAALEALTVETMRRTKAERERDAALADVAKLREALAHVMGGSCGPDCASTCRHVNASDCTGCEAIAATARAALADTEEAKSDG